MATRERPPAALAIALSHHGDGTTAVTLVGELDVATSPRLEQCLDDVVRTRPATVVIDCHRLTFCDSSGLAALVGAARRLEPGILRIERPQASLRRILQLTGLDDTFEVRPA